MCTGGAHRTDLGRGLLVALAPVRNELASIYAVLAEHPLEQPAGDAGELSRAGHIAIRATQHFLQVVLLEPGCRLRAGLRKRWEGDFDLQRWRDGGSGVTEAEIRPGDKRRLRK